MLRRVVLYLAVILAGLLTGYFSGSIHNFFWPADRSIPVGLSALKQNQAAGQNGEPAGEARELTADLQISGLRLTMTRKEVEEFLGQPQNSKRIYDQTLAQRVRIYSYPGLEVVFNNRDQAAKITASKAEYKGPKDIRVGDSQKSVLKALGRPLTSSPGLLIYIPAKDKNGQLRIKLVNEHVSEMSITGVAGKQ